MITMYPSEHTFHPIIAQFKSMVKESGFPEQLAGLLDWRLKCSVYQAFKEKKSFLLSMVDGDNLAMIVVPTVNISDEILGYKTPLETKGGLKDIEVMFIVSCFLGDNPTVTACPIVSEILCSSSMSDEIALNRLIGTPIPEVH